MTNQALRSAVLTVSLAVILGAPAASVAAPSEDRVLSVEALTRPGIADADRYKALNELSEQRKVSPTVRHCSSLTIDPLLPPEPETHPPTNARSSGVPQDQEGI